MTKAIQLVTIFYLAAFFLGGCTGSVSRVKENGEIYKRCKLESKRESYGSFKISEKGYVYLAVNSNNQYYITEGESVKLEEVLKKVITKENRSSVKNEMIISYGNADYTRECSNVVWDGVLFGYANTDVRIRFLDKYCGPIEKSKLQEISAHENIFVEIIDDITPRYSYRGNLVGSQLAECLLEISR